MFKFAYSQVSNVAHWPVVNRLFIIVNNKQFESSLYSTWFSFVLFHSHYLILTLLNVYLIIFLHYFKGLEISYQGFFILFSAWFCSALNAFVHIVMYTYYALAAIPSMRGKLWWKKYITRLQLVRIINELFLSVSLNVAHKNFSYLSRKLIHVSFSGPWTIN